MTIATLALIVTQSVSAGTVNPATKGYSDLEMLTFFTFFVGYIAMGAAFVFFMAALGLASLYSGSSPDK